MSEISDINNSFVKHYAEFSSQNSLTTLLLTDEGKVDFILYISIKAFQTSTSASSRFEPNPSVYFPLIYNDTLSQDEMTVFFEYIKSDNILINLLNSMGREKSKITDNEFCDYLSRITSIGWKFVYMLYFIIFTNAIAFTTEKINGLHSKMDIRIFKVSHTTEKEQEFYDIGGKSMILMHGTGTHNLYSIMRNGIKSMSCSDKYKSNGAVHGDGVYLSENIYTVTDYSKKPIVNILSSVQETETKDICVLYFNVKNPNPKRDGWCFVQQENEIILRCILWYKEPESTSNLGILDKPIGLFEIVNKYAQGIKYIPVTTKTIEKASSNSGFLSFPTITSEPRNSSKVILLPRFRKETERFFNMVSLGKDPSIIKANFAVPGDNTTPLLISVMPDIETELYKDLINNNIPGILLALYFMEGSQTAFEYPNVPFRMRVVSPMFLDGTGRVTKGGSICTDQLYQAGWSPACTIESVVRGFANTVGHEGAREGPGRVDMARLGGSYKYSDYLASYDQVAMFHGWQSTSK